MSPWKFTFFGVIKRVIFWKPETISTITSSHSFSGVHYFYAIFFPIRFSVSSWPIAEKIKISFILGNNQNVHTKSKYFAFYYHFKMIKEMWTLPSIGETKNVKKFHFIARKRKNWKRKKLMYLYGWVNITLRKRPPKLLLDKNRAKVSLK